MMYGIVGATIEEVVASFEKRFPHLRVLGEEALTKTNETVIVTARVKSEENGREYPERGLGALVGHPGPTDWMGSTTSSTEVRCWSPGGICQCQRNSGLVPERACESCGHAEFRWE